ncbi:MAG TPA: 3-hydroxyacyl-CoA dehydrogenase family protein [Chitinophagaceae bacterium]|nr:3-hydroxyacyl-CoA dehydrogenase family protein [Chitinophagaceae bacterium]
MKITVIADDALKEELLTKGLDDSVYVQWLNEPLAVNGINCCIDLLFINSEQRIEALKESSAGIIIINAVSSCLGGLPENFVRINGWPTFLKRKLVEASGRNDEMKHTCEKIFSAFGKKTEWTPDIPGFISARVVSQIINEAYFALEEKVSSKQEIDTAMKLGTNYPYGPFEWSQKIGLKNVYELLLALSKENSMYEPSSLLKSDVTG